MRGDLGVRAAAPPFHVCADGGCGLSAPTCAAGGGRKRAVRRATPSAKHVGVVGCARLAWARLAAPAPTCLLFCEPRSGLHDMRCMQREPFAAAPRASSDAVFLPLGHCPTPVEVEGLRSVARKLVLDGTV